MPTDPDFRDLTKVGVTALALTLLTSTATAQGGWTTTPHDLDSLPDDLAAPKSLHATDLFGEGTTDGLLQTELGPLLIYGLGRYEHQGLITLAGTTKDVGFSSNGPGLPVTAFVLKDPSAAPGASELHPLAPNTGGLALGAAFTSQEIQAGGAFGSWTGTQNFGIVTATEKVGAMHRVAWFFTTQPGSSRFGGVSAQYLDLGTQAPDQFLIDDVFTVGDPLMVWLQGQTLTAQSTFSGLVVSDSTPLQDGRITVCTDTSGCSFLYWVGLHQGVWKGQAMQIVSDPSPALETDGPLDTLAPHTASMFPLHAVEFADFDGDGLENELCLTFDDRILITVPDDPASTDQWLPDVTPNAGSPYSNSSPASLGDFDNDGDLDIAVAYANAAGTLGQLVVHENPAEDAASLAPSLVGQSVAFSPAPYNTLTLEIDPSTLPDWNEVEVLVYDVPLAPTDDLSDIANWAVLPEFTAIAAAKGTLSDGMMVEGRWQLSLDIGPETGISTRAGDRFALVEMRRRKVTTAGAVPEQPVMGPSTFYVADLNRNGTSPLSDSSSFLWSLPISPTDLSIPEEVRPLAEVPVIRILTHRPPRRGDRPNPNPGAGAD